MTSNEATHQYFVHDTDCDRIASVDCCDELEALVNDVDGPNVNKVFFCPGPDKAWIAITPDGAVRLCHRTRSLENVIDEAAQHNGLQHMSASSVSQYNVLYKDGTCV